MPLVSCRCRAPPVARRQLAVAPLAATDRHRRQPPAATPADRPPMRLVTAVSAALVVVLVALVEVAVVEIAAAAAVAVAVAVVVEAAFVAERPRPLPPPVETVVVA